MKDHESDAGGTGEPVSQRQVKAAGINFRINEAGPRDGPAIILLHGFPESARAWRKLMDPLARKGFRVIAPDMRGYGGSDAPEGIEPYALGTLAADIPALADALGIAGFVLVGHDWGGIIAWAVAAAYPDRVDRLIILNAPNPGIFGRTARRYPLQLLRSFYVGVFQLPRLPERLLSANNFSRLRKTLIRSARPLIFSESELAAYVEEWSQRGRLIAMLNYYRALRLPQPRPGPISMPTLILWGRRDSFLLPALADESARTCLDGRIRWFNDATHWLHHEQPRQVATEIAAFASGGK